MDVMGTIGNILEKVDPKQTIRVSMLGPSGVGKTSLLATMYEQLGLQIARTDLQVRPFDISDASILDDKVMKLRRLFANDNEIIDASQGIEGTTDFRSFDFMLGRRGQSPKINLQFIDYPGGWIDREATPGEKAFVLDVIKDSDALLIPIDTPALLERNGQWHHERNRPDFIFELIQLAYENLKAPRLVILAPMRCELYLQKPEYCNIMVENVKEGYSKLLDHLAFGHHSKLVAVVVAPVQTLGNIFYEKSPQNRYEPHFKKTHPEAVYAPRDSEQPLRYLLRYVMRLHRDQRQVGYFNLVRNMFQKDDFLIEAANTFAAGSKENRDGFVIIQGSQWLENMKRS